jgi:hypothetical protein
MNPPDHYKVLLDAAKNDLESYDRGLAAVLEKKRIRDEKHAKFLRIINKQIKKWNNGKQAVEERIKAIQSRMVVEALQQAAQENPKMKAPDVVAEPVRTETPVDPETKIVSETTGEEVVLSEEEIRQLQELASEE